MSSSSPAAPPPVRILIVGTGAVGAFYGSRLALAPNTTVSVTCRSNYAAVRDSGLTLNTHSFGSYHFKPHSIHPSITSAAQSSPYDYILLATKALPDLINDAELLQPLLTDSPSTSIVLVQNGVGIEQPHRLLFPQNPILSAVAMANAAQTSPGTIKQNRWTRISLGPFVGKQGDEELRRRSERETKRFVRLLKEGGIEDAEEYDEKGMQLVRWHKLAINCSMNPSSVLSGSTGVSRMCFDPELRQHLKGCMKEIFSVGPKVLETPWPEKLAQVDAEMILKSVERNTDGMPSMLLDWKEGRPMELEVILGNPIRMAREKGIEMPRLQTLSALLKMASIRRDEDKKLAAATVEEKELKAKL